MAAWLSSCDNVSTMSLRILVAAQALVCLLPTLTLAQTPPPTSAAGGCTIVGPVLGPSDFGVPAGQPVADVSALRLADGRIRLYVFAQSRGIVSAVSLTPEGTAFAVEAGSRLPDGSGMPRAVALSDGRVRLFYTSGSGIKSAISTDGVNFSDEPGFRMTATAADFGGTTARATSGATIVALADGSYRMYFSDLPRPGDPPGNHLIKSAVSRDQMAWSVEAGIRLGPGAQGITESSEHPFALSNPDGSVTLYYGKFGNTGSANAEGLYQSTSTDGLTFTSETYDVFFGNDPDAVRRTDGSVLLYYGAFDPLIGGTINAAVCPAPGGSPLTIAITGTAGSGSFNPNPLSAAVGDRVVFRNDDGVTHRLVLDATSVEIGTLAPGQSSAPVSVTSASMTYHCTIHPSMVGTIGTVPAGTTPPPPPPPDDGGGYYGYRLRNHTP